MNCQHIILHRLRNTKPAKRREPCCNKRAGLYAIVSPTGRRIRIWLCKKHWPGTKFSNISTGMHNLLPLQAEDVDIDLDRPD